METFFVILFIACLAIIMVLAMRKANVDFFDKGHPTSHNSNPITIKDDQNLKLLKSKTNEKNVDFRVPAWILIILWYFIISLSFSQKNSIQDISTNAIMATAIIPWLLWMISGVINLRSETKTNSTKTYRVFRVLSLLLPPFFFIVFLAAEDIGLPYAIPWFLYFGIWIIYLLTKKIIIPALQYINQTPNQTPSK